MKSVPVFSVIPTGVNSTAMHFKKAIIEMSEVEFGRRFALFLKNGASFVTKGPGLLVVDRTKPFDPSKFIGSGWTIWRGPKDGDGLTGEEAQDARSLKLVEIDFAKVLFEHGIKKAKLSSLAKRSSRDTLPRSTSAWTRRSASVSSKKKAK